MESKATFRTKLFEILSHILLSGPTRSPGSTGPSALHDFSPAFPGGEMISVNTSSIFLMKSSLWYPLQPTCMSNTTWKGWKCLMLGEVCRIWGHLSFLCSFSWAQKTYFKLILIRKNQAVFGSCVLITHTASYFGTENALDTYLITFFFLYFISCSIYF